MRSKYIRGKETLETLTGRPDPGKSGGIGAVSPIIDTFLKEHLFADIFERDLLNYQDRELATISALVSLGGVEPMLQSHMGMGLNTGLSESQLRQVLSMLETAIGSREVDAGRRVLERVLSERGQP